MGYLVKYSASLTIEIFYNHLIIARSRSQAGDDDGQASLHRRLEDGHDSRCGLRGHHYTDTHMLVSTTNQQHINANLFRITVSSPGPPSPM